MKIQYVCELCGKSFNELIECVDHETSCHTGFDSFVKEYYSVNRYPTNILVKMKDGTVINYKYNFIDTNQSELTAQEGDE